MACGADLAEHDAFSSVKGYAAPCDSGLPYTRILV